MNKSVQQLPSYQRSSFIAAMFLILSTADKRTFWMRLRKEHTHLYIDLLGEICTARQHFTNYGKRDRKHWFDFDIHNIYSDKLMSLRRLAQKTIDDLKRSNP